MNSSITHESVKPRGAVVTYACRAVRNPRCHEGVTQRQIAMKLAAIKDCDFAEEFDASYRYRVPLYFVPNDTLVDLDLAHGLGIHSEQHLFGGVVPFPFAATKTITHPLADADSRAPDGWSSDFARRVQDAVLPGFSAFSMEDARSAGVRLLKDGPVRIKHPKGIGGLGQAVIADEQDLVAQLQSVGGEDLLRDGVVLELNLAQVATYSIGQVRVGKFLATYHGIQRLTANHRGEKVYGGSDLIVVRGDFDSLLQRGVSPEIETAIAQARTYHTAAFASFRGMFASRCNYDVAQGVDSKGRWRSGVLEQSWRIGGASAAEVAALGAFQEDSALDVVRASTTEIYGDQPVPADAVVYFHGIDEHVGPMIKYSRIEPYADAR